MTAEFVAKKVSRGIKIRKRTIIISAHGIAAVWLSRILPELMDRLVYNHMKKEDDEQMQILREE